MKSLLPQPGGYPLLTREIEVKAGPQTGEEVAQLLTTVA
jgi:hypothetical protein